MKTTNEIRTAIESAKARSAWSRGVKMYGIAMLKLYLICCVFPFAIAVFDELYCGHIPA